MTIVIEGDKCDLSWVRCPACREDHHYKVSNGQLILKKASDTAKERAAETAARVDAMHKRVEEAAIRKRHEKARQKKGKKWWQFWKKIQSK
jgi:hypothetical protein